MCVRETDIETERQRQRESVCEMERVRERERDRVSYPVSAVQATTEGQAAATAGAVAIGKSLRISSLRPYICWSGDVPSMPRQFCRAFPPPFSSSVLSPPSHSPALSRSLTPLAAAVCREAS